MGAEEKSYQIFNNLLFPKIFQTFLQRTGRNANDVIFIDDMEANVATAKKLGFKGIVCKSVPQVKEALVAYGISV